MTINILTDKSSRQQLSLAKEQYGSLLQRSHHLSESHLSSACIDTFIRSPLESWEDW